VERDVGLPAEGVASFHTTRWTLVMSAVQSQAPGSQSALAQLCRNYWYPTYVFAPRLRKRYSTLLREEIGRTVSDSAEIDEEIRTLCEALIASEGRLGP
jgi:hypothetical protein